MEWVKASATERQWRVERALRYARIMRDEARRVRRESTSEWARRMVADFYFAAHAFVADAKCAPFGERKPTWRETERHFGARA
jgi:hypothetical protein